MYRIHRAHLIAALIPLLGFPIHSWAASHPRLLMTDADLGRIRHACGVGDGSTALNGWGRLGAKAADYQALRDYFAARVQGAALPGELLAAAFLQRTSPNAAGRGVRLGLISAALAEPPGLATDPLERVIALDWCWEDIEPAVRREFLSVMEPTLTPLAPGDSPLDPRVFRARLASLAVALIIDGKEDDRPAWLELRATILDAARSYFESTLPKFIEWRGLSPTSPAAAAGEEVDTALALELARELFSADPWPAQRDTVGRWLEHYVFQTLDHPALQYQFIRDDGTTGALTPVREWQNGFPISAHLIANRTRDPAAALIADRVERRMRDGSEPTAAALWRWVPILFDLSGIPRANSIALPLLRDLGGAVVIRSGSGPLAINIWIEAGQPFLRRRQHFDAGHFLIRAGGELLTHAGEDITFEAVPSRGGQQRLGLDPKPFDYEQFFTATIAHNSLICYEPIRLANWYGRTYEPAGGQRCVEGTCQDFKSPLVEQGRLTAEKLAVGAAAAVGYVALDLTPAYDPRAIAQYVREFVFHESGFLLVVDRIDLPHTRAAPILTFQIPARPVLENAALDDATRTAGLENDGGIWRINEVTSLDWTDRDGRIRCIPIAPETRRVRVVGGPAAPRRITEGPNAGRSYVGGEAEGFESLILPGDRRPRNAWFELGSPALLGPTFGLAPHWGRLEIEPQRAEPRVLFATLFLIGPAAGPTVPQVTTEVTDAMLQIRIVHDGLVVEFLVKKGAARGGTTTSGGVAWPWPDSVDAAGPLPVLLSDQAPGARTGP